MAANFLFCWLNHSLKLLFSFFFHTQNLKFHNGTAIVVPISMTDTLNGSYYYYDSYHLYGSYYIWWLLASIAMLAIISTADTLYGSYYLYG